MGLFSRAPRQYGWIPDAIDSRDRHVSSLLSAVRGAVIPVAHSLKHPAVTPRDQGSVPDCVGFAWAQALELASAQQGLLVGDLSPAFLYFLACAQTGGVLTNGTTLRAAAKVAVRYGAAHETACPTSKTRLPKGPTARAFSDAYVRRGARGYYRIDPSDLDAIKRALAAGYPIVGGWTVDRTFESYSGVGLIAPATGELLGGHALCIVGYTAGTFEILNSWGTSWGNGGYATVSPAWVASGSDLWSVDVGR